VVGITKRANKIKVDLSRHPIKIMLWKFFEKEYQLEENEPFAQSRRYHNDMLYSFMAPCIYELLRVNGS
jgi:hypothetical protein